LCSLLEEIEYLLVALLVEQEGENRVAIKH
jgi:hypothetical protein